MKEVSTSFLSKEDYKKAIEHLNQTTTDYIHFDVMDGKFVENKNLLIRELEKYLKISEKKNDIHLMVKEPQKYIDKLSLFNISYITIHYEINNLDENIELIKQYGFKVGISLKPQTEIEKIYPYLKKVNMVLIMSVEPGKSGQKFIPESIEKINKLKEEIKKQKLSTKIEIDGGINDEVLEQLKNADIIVSASYILNNFDNINKIKNI